MKTIINAAVAVLLFGSAGIVRADATTRHHLRHANADRAFSATVSQPNLPDPYRNVSDADGNAPHQTATGGPVGGIN